MADPHNKHQVPPSFPKPTEDDQLDMELREEIRRISTSIDTIIQNVDEADPVFGDQNRTDGPAKQAPQGPKEPGSDKLH
jgi:hypothetical protein